MAKKHRLNSDLGSLKIKEVKAYSANANKKEV